MIIPKDKEFDEIRKRVKAFDVWRCKQELSADDIIIETGTLLHISVGKIDDEKIRVRAFDNDFTHAALIIPADKFDEYFEKASELQPEIDKFQSIWNKEGMMDRISSCLFYVLGAIAAITIALWAVVGIMPILPESWLKPEAFAALPTFRLYAVIGAALSLISICAYTIVTLYSKRLFVRRLQMPNSTLLTHVGIIHWPR